MQPLNNVALKKGCDCSLSEVPTIIYLNKCGVYRIAVTADAVASTGGNIQLRLYKSGVAQPQSGAEVTASDTTSIHNLGFETLVQVTQDDSCRCCGPLVAIQIFNKGVGITLNSLDVVVTRVGMMNEDGTKGPHWSVVETSGFKRSSVVSESSWNATMNMMYSDYYKVAEKYGLNRPDFYADLAEAFLNDKDADRGEAKLAQYYYGIVG